MKRGTNILLYTLLPKQVLIFVDEMSSQTTVASDSRQFKPLNLALLRMPWKDSLALNLNIPQVLKLSEEDY